MSETLQQMKTLMTILEQDVQKFNSGKKVYGTRARGDALNLKKQCDLLRKQLLESQKAIPTKARVKTVKIVEPTE